MSILYLIKSYRLRISSSKGRVWFGKKIEKETTDHRRARFCYPIRPATELNYDH